jgi:hypothetical protein
MQIPTFSLTISCSPLACLKRTFLSTETYTVATLAIVASLGENLIRKLFPADGYHNSGLYLKKVRKSLVSPNCLLWPI